MDKQLKISIYTIFEVIIYMLVFADIRNNNIRYGLIIVIGIFLTSKITYELLKKNLQLNRLLSIFVIISLVISNYNRGETIRNSFLSNIVFACILIEFVLFVEVISEKKGIQHFLKTASVCAIVICIITDVLAFTIGEDRGLYLIGTKFQVFYQHMLAITLYMVANIDSIKNKKSIKSYKYYFNVLVILILTIVISMKMECSTGIVGIIVFFLVMALIRLKESFFISPVTFIGAIILSFCFMWSFEGILMNKQIVTFITVYLQRSLSLTGRTIIYSKMALIMNKHWLLGFGYGSTYEVCMSKIGFADTQNALMEWIMQLGVIGTTSLFIMLVYAFYQLKYQRECRQWIYLVAYIYTLVFIGTVEITYTMYFFGVIVMIYILGKEKRRI